MPNTPEARFWFASVNPATPDDKPLDPTTPLPPGPKGPALPESPQTPKGAFGLKPLGVPSFPVTGGMLISSEIDSLLERGRDNGEVLYTRTKTIVRQNKQSRNFQRGPSKCQAKKWWMGGWHTFASFFAKVGAEDSCSAGLPSHLRRRPLKYKTWLASAESIDPKRDRLAESHLSKNERSATRRKTMLPGTLASSYFAAIL